MSGWTRALLILAATESTELRNFLLRGLHQTVSVYLLMPELVVIQFLLADRLQAKLILATSFGGVEPSEQSFLQQALRETVSVYLLVPWLAVNRFLSANCSQVL